MANHTRKNNKFFSFQHRDNNHVNRKTSTPLTKDQVSSSASCSDEEDNESGKDDDDDGDERESSITTSTFSSQDVNC